MKLTDKGNEIFWGRYKGIYAYMYGHPTINVVRDGKPSIEPDKIIFIEREKLDIGSNGFVYVWGWPGPDYNYYDYDDYGITWALTEDELLSKQGKDNME